MTRDQIEKLEALSRAATPPPWAELLYQNEGWVDGPGGRSMTVGYEGEMTGEDVRLIAAMRNALPRLLLERERLIAAFARLNEHGMLDRGDCRSEESGEWDSVPWAEAKEFARAAVAFVEEEA